MTKDKLYSLIQDRRFIWMEQPEAICKKLVCNGVYVRKNGY